MGVIRCGTSSLLCQMKCVKFEDYRVGGNVVLQVSLLLLNSWRERGSFFGVAPTITFGPGRAIQYWVYVIRQFMGIAKVCRCIDLGLTRKRDHTCFLSRFLQAQLVTAVLLLPYLLTRLRH